jgi:hypothetical protein
MGKVKRHLEGKRSFSNYKRMHWVVCKTQEKKRLKDFRERFEEERKGQQRRCISQRRLGTFPKAYLCGSVLIFFVVVGGRIVGIHTVCTARDRGHEFRGI